MRIIKLGIISFVFFSLLLLAFTFLIPAEIRISRAIDVKADKAVLMPFIADTTAWSKWNSYLMDTSRRFRISDLNVSDSLVSSIWKTGDRVFKSSFALYETRPGTITLQWYFDFDLGWYPWEKIAGITYDKQTGPVMEESLARLKRLVESNP